jgi:hypothetical protein
LKAETLLSLGVIEHWDDDEDEIAAAQEAGIKANLVSGDVELRETMLSMWAYCLHEGGVEVAPKMKKYLDKHPYMEPDGLQEKWSEKYKRSIDCNNPKGFSQKAHCAGRKKRKKTN